MTVLDKTYWRYRQTPPKRKRDLTDKAYFAGYNAVEGEPRPVWIQRGTKGQLSAYNAGKDNRHEINKLIGEIP